MRTYRLYSVNVYASILGWSRTIESARARKGTFAIVYARSRPEALRQFAHAVGKAAKTQAIKASSDRS